MRLARAVLSCSFWLLITTANSTWSQWANDDESGNVRFTEGPERGSTEVLSAVVQPQLLSPRLKRSTNGGRPTGANAKGNRAAADSILLSLPMGQLHSDVVLNLTISHELLAPNFLLQHLTANQSWFEGDNSAATHNSAKYYRPSAGHYQSTKETHKSSLNSLANCIYTGVVVGDIDSNIVLNLCRGLQGSLRVSDETYFIEPFLNGSVPESIEDPYNYPHRLYKEIFTQTFQGDTLEKPKSARRRNDTADGNVIRYTSDTHGKTNKNGPTTTSHKFVNLLRDKRELMSPSVGIWSYHYYVELLVVADFKMKMYHGANLENYVLTLLSIVASIYRHPSIEAAINIVVVRIVELDHEGAGPGINENAQETLRNFCKWQQMLNDPVDNSLNHHDAAILLTRQDICRAPGKCDTLGLAELGTMCDGHRSCAIIEDNGLSAAFTIAHELGHIFNIPHDDEKKCKDYMTLDKANYHIMAPTLEFNTHPWSWSVCSAKQLRKFLDNQRNVFCIRNEPSQRKFRQMTASQKAPGVIFDANQQCRFVFGQEAALCPYMPTCKRLWCATTYGYQVGCRTQHMPWADGTPCAYQKWCHKGECVGLPPDNITPIDGGWGQWHEWSDCSRSCGGGAKNSTRECDSPRPEYGGKYCEGMRVRYQSCNSKDCPVESDFRAEQCATFHGNSFKISGLSGAVQWVPKYSGINPVERCRLWCRVTGSAAFYPLRDKVIDGTPCGRYTDDMCINGECHQAGCDHKLGSTVTRDLCGVCGGNGNSCEKQFGTYNERRAYGYNFVFKIPSGTANIDIRQHSWNGKKEDDNYLAIQNSKGEFILNGHFQVSVFQQEVPIRGTVLYYSGSDNVIETLNSSRPTKEDVFIHVLSVGNIYAPDIRWEYVVSKSPQKQDSTPDYIWRYAENWDDCNKQCQGTQSKRVICADTNSDKEADANQCKDIKELSPVTKACNTHCNLRWHAEPKGECSAVCGNGEQQRSVSCVMSNSEAHQTVDSQYCDSTTKPESVAPCYKDCAGRQWIYAGWKPCSATCGKGIEIRDAVCTDRNNQQLDARYCDNLPQEPNSRECNSVPCPTWQYSDWSDCSHSCDGGSQFRRAVCVDIERRTVDSRLCNEADKLISQKCNEHLCTAWKYGEWSQCSKTCGDGIAHRDAVCTDSQGGQQDDSVCDEQLKQTSKKCEMPKCPVWKSGDWSPCPVTCLDGWMSRSVDCVDGHDRPLDPQYCENSGVPRPAIHQTCSNGPCPFWRVSDWEECSVSCGVGRQSRQIECLYKDQVVDDAYCRGDPKPEGQRNCNKPDCPVWEVGQWGPCSITCGGGIQYRPVFCHFPNSGHRTSEENCRNGRKPRESKECNRDDCPNTTRIITTSTTTPATTITAVTTALSTIRVPTVAQVVSATLSPLALASRDSEMGWDTGLWTECTATCGPGVEQRYVACRDSQGRLLGDSNCSHLPRPSHKQRCYQPPCGYWSIDDWEPCAETCGIEVETRRSVKCVSMAPNEPEDPLCDANDKPIDRRSCQLQVCPEVNVNRHDNDVNHNRLLPKNSAWTVGSWSQCSKSCGWGWQRRQVACMSTAYQHSDEDSCDPADRPAPIQICRISGCPQWQTSEWHQCSKSCGGGVQRRSVECRIPDHPVPLPDQSCTEAKPKTQQLCNAQLCRRLIWRTGKWSSCSTVCGLGTRTREILCADEDGNIHPNDSCNDTEVPASRHQCRMKRCPQWKKSKWSECSVTCGEGIRSRQVECRLGRKNLLSEGDCQSDKKPVVTAKCKMASCPAYRWDVGRWFECSTSCGKGEQIRDVSCVNNNNRKAPLPLCNPVERPKSVRECLRFDCPYEWHPASWSSCSQTCDSGVQKRSLQCRLKTNHSGVLASEVPVEKCQILPKPLENRNCSLGPCSAGFFWQMGGWAECSVTCGWGVQRRKVFCLNRMGHRVKKANCIPKLRPPSRRNCFNRNCEATDCREVKTLQNTTVDNNYPILVKGQRINIFCYGMNTPNPTEYLPLPVGDANNFAEIYDKRLVQPFTCPYNGERNDSCECSKVVFQVPRAGLSRFTKVRVDLANMKIIGTDFRFATTETGESVAFGTAGDCYSAVDCPQGQFSIDLRGTGLKISHETVWYQQGNRPYKTIHRYEGSVALRGRCGGYCGTCAPDPRIGLRLDLAVFR